MRPMPTGETRARKLTYDDYLAIPDDGRRHEILDGVHLVSPAPTVRHQLVVGELHFRIRAHLEGEANGRLLLAPTDVLLSEHDVVQPDLFFLSTARAGRLTAENVQGAPDLVVEVLSPSTRRRDEVEKRARYPALGVTEYWIVDPDAESIRVYRTSSEGRFELAQEATAASADEVATPLLPGLVLRVAEVFEDLPREAGAPES